ncbi:uncharacterized protein TRIVIDRAFT_223867 [Trichoderma virens Gv29-8]|uniref:Uncharacterized protein n=1 Tax=Hypocrea virens (strain Gv29-8 / FGSC 10586) TaxID=413071 RepID=G9MYC8_HYPVG|nr:uncharacterized protein TRIVIDRAFT_223867 [Trichoderma virens Gv29-8]EHK20550.1 hypothetical protein TRIVIDRAFT_223867 [Trichoderma virens Gv29-8]UKZ53009.1 hypothetical protein TrVGV298_006796 [Trichoderma virens]
MSWPSSTVDRGPWTVAEALFVRAAVSKAELVSITGSICLCHMAWWQQLVSK